MKRFIALILAAGMALLPAAGFAEEGLSAPEAQSVLSRFLDQPVDPEAVSRPLDPEYDLRMLHLTATEAFLRRDPEAGTMLYIIFRVEAKSLNSLPVFLEQEQEDQIEYEGKSVSLEQFRGNKSLISCELVAGHSWAWYDYSGDGLFIITCVMNPDTASLSGGSKVSFSCRCENLQTGETENGTVVVSLPPMAVR